MKLSSAVTASHQHSSNPARGTKMKTKLLIAGISLSLISAVTAPVNAGDTAAIMGFVNNAMSDASRALDSSTSTQELGQIQHHYEGWANRFGGSVSEMEMRNRLAQRYYEEQAYRQQTQATQDADDAQRQAQEVLNYVEWLFQ